MRGDGGTKWTFLSLHLDQFSSADPMLCRCLAPGGLLILEPQPWKSYNSAVHKQDMHEVPFRRYEQLKLRPEGFVEFLTSRVGFVLLEKMQPELLAAVREVEGGGGVEGQAKQQTACAAAAGGGDGGVDGGVKKRLEQELGQAVGEAGKGKVRGFDRPIYVLQKPLAKAS